MIKLSRRAVLASLVATPSARLPVTKSGPPKVPSSELHAGHLVAQAEWSLDVYAGRIALRYRGTFHWANLADDVLSIVPRCYPNAHDHVIKQESYNAGDKDAFIGLGVAEHLRLVTIGDELDRDYRAQVRHVRFGRIGVARAHIGTGWVDCRAVPSFASTFPFGLDDLTGVAAPWPTEAPLLAIAEGVAGERSKYTTLP